MFIIYLVSFYVLLSGLGLNFQPCLEQYWCEQGFAKPTGFCCGGPQDGSRLNVQNPENITEWCSIWVSYLGEGELKGKELDVSKAQLPRRRQPPKRVDGGQSDANFPRTEQDYYRSIYFEALDLLGSGIKSIIDKPGYKNNTNHEKLLLKTALRRRFLKWAQIINLQR